MSNQTAGDSERERRLDAAVVEYLEAAEAGQEFDTAAWLARYPDLAAELEDFLSDQEDVRRWTDPLKQVAKTIPLEPHASAAAAARPRSRPETLLGEYELLDEIARGGMGVVYRARQVPLNRVVALKMILAGGTASAAELARFQREAEVFASLDHPHIMPIYDVGVHDGRPYFSMKLVEGGNLTPKLAQLRGDGEGIARLLVLIARAVHHAHQRGILHRDLKPDNILVDADGQPYVTDFGLARPVQGDSGMTQSGAIVGTPSYMSPEQAAGSKDVTTAIDIYGLGAILYALISGSPPFRGETPVETVRQVLEDEPLLPRLANPQVARDLETICMKCLQKAPEQRYGSAEALAQDLERWLEGEPIQARRSSAWERTVKKAKRNPMAAALLAVSTTAVVAGIVGGFLFQQQRLRAEKQQNQLNKQQLAKEGQLRETEAKIRTLISQGKVHLASGEPNSAAEQLSSAMTAAGSEPSLRVLRNQADELLRVARATIEAQQVQRDWAEKYDRFAADHGKVIFEGTQFTGVDRSAAIAATLQAGERALSLFGLQVDGGGTFYVDEHLSDHAPQIAERCYEILLIVAGAVAQREPAQFDQALRLLDQAVQLRPPTESYHLRRAQYLTELERPQAAGHQTKLAGAMEPSSALDFFLQGDDLLRRGQPRAAVRMFEKAVQVQPDHFWAQYLAGITRLQLRDYVHARIHLTSCLIQDHKMRAWVHLHRGLANTALEDLAAAEADFGTAYQLQDRTLRHEDLVYAILVNRGILRRTQRRYEAAAADFSDAIRRRPNAYQAYSNLANVYVDMGQLDQGLRQLGRAVEIAAEQPQQLDPAELSQVYHRRATLLWELDRPAALSDLQQELGIHEHADAYLMLGNHLQEEGQFEAAVKVYKKALRTPALANGTYSRALNRDLLAECELALGRYEHAARTLDEYVAEDGPRDDHYYRLRGLIRSRLGDYSGAIHDYSMALGIEPDHPETLTQRGWVHYFTGAQGLALRDFERAIEVQPDYAEPYGGRASVRVSFGEYAQGAADAEESLRRQAAAPEFRTLWNAARIHAMVAQSLHRRFGYRDYDSSTRTKHFQRALELMHQAIETVSAEDLSERWQKFFEQEPAFETIRRSREFARLRQAYGGGNEKG